MTSISDQLEDATTLYTLAAGVRREAGCWREAHIRRGLRRAANQLDTAARETLRQPSIYAEAWIDAGRHYLDQHVMHRRFIEQIGTPLSIRNRRPIHSLDCRDGKHGACTICDCQCHRWRP